MAGNGNNGRPTAVRVRAAWLLAVLGGAVALGLLAGGPVRSAGDDEAKGDVPADLRLVPRDALAFLSVRLGDVWNRESMQGVREAIKKQSPEVREHWLSHVGLPPGDIERLTMVILDFDARAQPMPLFFVHTAKPYGRDKVLAAVAANAKEEKRGGHTLYVGDKGETVHFIDDNDYVTSSADAVRSLLERPAAKEGVLDGALKLAAGKHAVVAGLNPETLEREAADKLPAEAEPFRPLLKTQTATLTVDLDKGLRGRLRLAFAKEPEAKDATEPVKSGLFLARGPLAQGIKELDKQGREAAPIVELLKNAEAGLKDAKVEQDGRNVEVGVDVKVDPETVGGTLLTAVQKVRQAAARTQSANNMKQIALAMINYADTYGNLPPQAIYGKDGKPLLSWRVMILPFIEQDQLYKQFHLDEPWDSAHNKKLLAQMPKVYVMPNSKETTKTFYQCFVGKGAFFEGKKGRKFPAEFTDGTSNTIMCVEAANPVPWTKPEDLPFNPDKPLPKLGGHFSGGFNAGLCDGSVRFVSNKISEKTLKAAITVNGGEVLGSDW
jgi:hypothetical protein